MSEVSMRILAAAIAVPMLLSCAAADGAGGGDGGSAGSSGFSGAAGSGGSSGSAGVAGSGGSAVGGSGGAGATGGAGGASGSSGAGGTGGSAGAPCGTPNTCQNAFDLGTISGDGGGSVTHGQSGSFFVKVRVTEDNHGVIGEALEVQLALQAPAGADVDAYVYLDPDADVSACGKTPFAKADVGGSGQNEQITFSWGDGLAGSNNDDDRTVVVEIAHKAGACAAWSLTLQGNP
jgi:hypothetical protein